MKLTKITLSASILTITLLSNAATADIPRKHKSSFKKVESAIKLCAMFSVNKRLSTAERNLKKYTQYKNKGLKKFPAAMDENFSVQFFTPADNSPPKTEKKVSEWLAQCDELMPKHIAQLKNGNDTKNANKLAQRKKQAEQRELMAIKQQLDATLSHCASINSGLIGPNLFNTLTSYVAYRDNVLSNPTYQKVKNAPLEYTIMITPAKRESLTKTPVQWFNYCNNQLDRMNTLIEAAKEKRKNNPYQ